MRKFFINTGMLLLGIIVATSCSNEESLEQMANNGNIVQAVIENEADTRTSVNDSYQVVWTADDKFDVWDGDTFKGILKLKAGAGSTSASFKDNDEENPVGATIGMTAFFPSYDGESSKKAFVFAEKYESLETDAPMLGSFDGSKFTFNLLTAMVRVVVTDVPAGEISFTISSKNSEILTGEAVLNNENKLDVPSQGKTSVSVNFTTDGVKTLTFDVPIPVQNYTDGFQVVVKSGEQEVLNKKTNGFNAVAGKLYLFGATYVNVADADAANEKLGNDGITAVKVQSVEAGDEIAIPAKSETSAQTEHIIDLSEATMPSGGSVTIKVAEASAGNTGSTVEKLTVIVPDNTTSGSFTIDAPGTTVTIQGADGTIIDVIESTTADQTLIIGEGVTIKNLTIKKGNVELYGKLEKFTSEVSTTIKLMKDIDLTSEWQIEQGMNVTLDLNGYTLAVDYATNHGIDNYGTLNIKGNNGKITWVTTDYGNNAVYCIVNRNGATMTIDACEIGGPVYNYGDMTVGNGSNLITDAVERGALLCGSDTKHIAWTFTMTGGSIVSKQHTAAVVKNNYVGLDSPGLAKFSGVTFSGTTYHDIVLWNVNIEWENCTLVRDNVWLDADEYVSYVNGNPTRKENLQPCKWEDIFNAPVTSLDALATAITAAPADGTPTTILLGGNIDVTQELTIQSGQNITLDLNGKMLAVNYETNHGIDNYGTLNIKGNNGKITWVTTDYGNNAVYCIVNRNGATMTIDACEVGGPVYNYGDMTIGNGSNLITDAANRGALLCGSDTKHIAWTFTMTGGSIVSKQHTAAVVKNNYVGLDSPGLAKFSGVTFSGTTYHDIVLWNVKIEWENCTLVRDNVWLDADEYVSYVNGNPTKKENLQPCKWAEIFPVTSEE